MSIASRMNNIIGGVKQGLPVIGNILGQSAESGFKNITSIMKPQKPIKPPTPPASPGSSLSNIPKYLKEQNSQLKEIDRLTK